ASWRLLREGMEMATEQKCEQRIDGHLKNRLEDIRELWTLYQKGNDKVNPDLGRFEEYGLSWDYVREETFKDQEQAFFRYQLSTGGPQDEFRFYVNPNFSAYKVEYWFLDWFDGAHRELEGNDKILLMEIWEYMREGDYPRQWFKEAGEE